MKRYLTIFLMVLLGATACNSAARTPPPPTQVPTQPPPASPTPSRLPAAGQIEPLPDGGVRLSTGDGVSLSLDADGQVTALLMDGEALPLTPAFPFVVRDLTSANAPDAPNLLDNPGFESGDKGWKPYLTNKVSISVSDQAAHTGSHALEIRAQGKNGQGAVTSTPIAVTPGQRYRLSGYFKIEFGYVDETGNPTFWQQSLYDGKRLVSGLYLQWLDSSGARLGNPQVAVALHWNAQEWRKITREVTAPPNAAAVKILAGAKPVSGAVWVDDLAWVESPESDQPLSGELEIAADHITQRGEVAGMQIAVTYRPYSNHIAVTATLTDPDGNARAFDAAWGLPLDAGGWTWWDDLRASRPITTGEDFANVVSADIAGYLPISLYPYTALENGTYGLALAQPLDSPRYVLLHYDGETNRYEGRAHLGISPLATKLDNSADFSLLLYRTDPAWGLRSAAEKHVAINPAWYESPMDFSIYSDATREHFSASGKRADLLRSLNQANVFASQYTVFEIPIQMESGDTPRPSFQEAKDAIAQAATSGEVAATYPGSLICDSAGDPHLKALNTYPWSDGKWSAIWIPNMDPDLPGGYGAARLQVLAALFRDTHQAGLQLDGVFIDNFLSATTVDLCPEHLAAADLPLTYDPNTYQPAVHVASAGWEYLTELRALLDSQPEPYRAIVINF